MIETEQLVQLAAFARYGTLSKAAEALHISQPSLSRTMQALEGELQASLFVRRKNRLALTEAGELAVRYAEKITAELDEMGRQVRALDRANRCVSIGVCAQVPGHDMTAAFAQADSGAAVACQMESDDAALWEGLRKGEYQIIVVHTRPPEDEELFWFASRDEKLNLLVPKDHPLAHRTELTRADLEHQNLLLYREIGFWYELSRQNLPSAHFLYTNEWDAFGELAGLGAFPVFVTNAFDVYPLPESSERRRGGVILPIRDEAFYAVYYFVCRAADKPRFQKLIAGLQADFRVQGF